MSIKTMPVKVIPHITYTICLQRSQQFRINLRCFDELFYWSYKSIYFLPKKM